MPVEAATDSTVWLDEETGIAVSSTPVQHRNRQGRVVQRPGWPPNRTFRRFSPATLLNRNPQPKELSPFSSGGTPYTLTSTTDGTPTDKAPAGPVVVDDDSGPTIRRLAPLVTPAPNT